MAEWRGHRGRCFCFIARHCSIICWLYGSQLAIRVYGRKVVIKPKMFCICLRLCYCKGLMAHLLNLCLSQAAQVSRTSKQSSSSLWQYSPDSPSPCLLQGLEALCPTVLERPGHGPD